MDLMVKPAYDEVQNALAHVPEDRKAWAALYQKAARLAEIENLRYVRTRAEAARKPEWAEACTACHHPFAREAPVIKP